MQPKRLEHWQADAWIAENAAVAVDANGLWAGVSERSKVGYLAADGSYLAWGDYSKGPMLVPPPDEEPAKLLRYKRDYLAGLLAKETHDFTAFKQDCERQARWAATYPQSCPPPPATAAEQLQRGADRIAELREKLAEANAELDEPAPDGGLHALHAGNAQRRQQLSAQQAAISAVTI